MKILNWLTLLIIIGFAILFSGCAGSGSYSTIYYESYYDPHPYWGYGDNRTIIIERPDKPNRPPKPIKPPGGGIGRPKPPGKRR